MGIIELLLLLPTILLTRKKCGKTKYIVFIVLFSLLALINIFVLLVEASSADHISTMIVFSLIGLVLDATCFIVLRKHRKNDVEMSETDGNRAKISASKDKKEKTYFETGYLVWGICISIVLIALGIFVLSQRGAKNLNASSFEDIKWLIWGIGYIITGVLGFVQLRGKRRRWIATLIQVVLGIFGAGSIYWHYYKIAIIKALLLILPLATAWDKMAIWEIVILCVCGLWWIVDIFRYALGMEVASEDYVPKSVPAQANIDTSGTKTIVKDAVKGGIIAGPSGAIIGAIVGKNKVDNQKK